MISNKKINERQFATYQIPVEKYPFLQALTNLL